MSRACISCRDSSSKLIYTYWKPGGGGQWGLENNSWRNNGWKTSKHNKNVNPKNKELNYPLEQETQRKIHQDTYTQIAQKQW